MFLRFNCSIIVEKFKVIVSKKSKKSPNTCVLVGSISLSGAFDYYGCQYKYIIMEISVN